MTETVAPNKLTNNDLAKVMFGSQVRSNGKNQPR